MALVIISGTATNLRTGKIFPTGDEPSGFGVRVFKRFGKEKGFSLIQENNKDYKK